MQPDQAVIENYLSELSDVLSAIPREPLFKIIAAIKQARADGRHIFIFGNGGSSSTASHMACDFGKNTRAADKPRLRVISLNDNMASLTAYANDEGYEVVFSEPLKSLAEPGDLVIAISGSGNSPNVLNGVKTARETGLMTIGLTGFQGGKLKDFVDVCLVVPSNSMEQIEDVHLIIDHILTVILK
jgi:D-sedoheptulose 7-phosphate isomerase